MEKKGTKLRPIVVVGLVFRQQEGKYLKLEFCCVFCIVYFGSYSSQRLLISEWSKTTKMIDNNEQFSLSLSLQGRKESPSPSTKGQIQSFPPFPSRLKSLWEKKEEMQVREWERARWTSRLRLLVSFPCLLVLSSLLPAAPAPPAPWSPPPSAPLHSLLFVQ